MAFRSSDERENSRGLRRGPAPPVIRAGDSVVFYLGYPKDFVHISVSQAADHLLIREQHFDGHLLFSADIDQNLCRECGI